MTSRTTPSTRPVRSIALGGVAGLAIAIAAPLAASAHVGVSPDTTAAGAYANLTFAVPHGCDGSSTTEVSITIPDGVVSVTPTVNPGWDVEEIASESDPDYTSAVVYTAKTPLPDGLRDTFTLSVPLPAGEPGDVIAFPVLQTCEVGSTDWNEETVDGEEEPEHPAPAITLTEAEDDGHGHAASAGEHDDETAEDATEETAGDAASADDGSDAVAIGLGAAGLLMGLAGIAIALWALRRRSA